MSDKPRKPHLQNLAVPVEMPGWLVDVNGISLSRADPSGVYRIGLFLQATDGPPETAVHLFLTPSDAAFLRDGLAEVLHAYRARQAAAN